MKFLSNYVYAPPGKLISALLIAMISLLILPQTALACGGLFYREIPISQDSERIVFTVDSDSLTMYEQLNYKGAAKDFAWVLPVPSVPELDTAPVDMFNSLDGFTAPRFIMPSEPSCGLQPMRFGGGDGVTGGAPPGSGVTVYSQGAVGPYAYDVVGSESSLELAEWLKKHEYNIPDNLQSMIEPYVQQKLLFLAMRLQPKADVQDILPIKVTVKAPNPQIAVKLRMAAASASPRMNLLVWIFGDQRFVPENYKSFEIQEEELSISPELDVNYDSVMQGAVDKLGGQAFITEYAKPTSDMSYVDDQIDGLVSKYRYVTRLHTSIKPEHMTIDPVFVPKANLPDVNNTVNLSNHPYPTTCDPVNLFLGDLGSFGIPLVAVLTLALIGGATGGVIAIRRGKIRKTKD